MLNITDVRQFFLGVQGENEEQTITIDVKPWLVAYPNGAISIYHKRNGESVPAPVTTVFDPEEGTISWTPTYTDTYVPGEGEAEIRLYENGVIKKTRTVKTGVAPSVTGAGSVTLESGWQGYITYVESLKNGATAAKADAEAAADEAEEYATITAHPPLVDETTGNWLLWDADEEDYVDSGYRAIGKSFVISKTYASVAAMQADFSNPELQEGDYVLISSGLTDADNGKVYMKGESAWVYVVQMAGQKGDTGATGTTFTPSVSAEGVISWTNDGGKENPTSRNIKGDKGDDGDPGEGVPTGGTTNQFLKKKSNTDYDTEWANVPDPTGKADKVSGATSGDFAGLDGNGNLTDSGKKAADFIASSLKGAASGVAELDENGYVPSSQLPSFVDDVLEYASASDFPATGEAGKIYIAKDTNVTYRWGGTVYVPIGSDLALGETSSTAYRGDRGKTAYDHATDSSRSTTAQASGLYKIATTAEGHVAGVSAVQKSDITELGIPESDTTYNNFSGATSDAAGAAGLVPAPAAGDQGKILMGDGTWSNDIPNRLAAVENVYEDQDISIQTTDWVNGVYTWTSNLVTAECGYEVFLRAGAENAGIETFDDAKVTGGIQFTIVSGTPIAALPLTVRIIKAKADSIVTLTGADIGTDVITGCDNVDEALDALDDAIATNSDHIANLYISPTNGGIDVTLYQSGNHYFVPNDGYYLFMFATNDAAVKVNTTGPAITGTQGNRMFVPLKKDTRLDWISGTTYIAIM